jgi:hypothetical protein
MRQLLGTLLAGVGLAAVAPSATAEPPVREVLRAGVTANVGQIRSFHADVTWSSKTAAGEVRKTGSFTMRDGTVRISETFGDRTTDVLVAQGVCKVYTSGPGAKRGPGYADLLIGVGHRKSVDVDVWEQCLFVLPVTVYKKPPLPAYSIDAALSVGEVLEEKMTSLEGRRVAYVRVRVDGTRVYDIYADPARNWAVVRCGHRIVEPGGAEQWDAQYTADEVREFAGVFVPTKVTAKLRYQAGATITQTVALDNVQVNDPRVPAITPLPVQSSGATAFDEVNNLTFQTDKTGKPVGPARRIGDDFIPAVPADDRTARRWFPWYVWGLIGVAGVGGFVYLRRRAGRPPSVPPGATS